MSYMCKLNNNNECIGCQQCEHIPSVNETICEVCGQVITEDYYYTIDNLIQCESCVNKEYMHYIEDGE